ncbi:MAG: YitT family protein [Candidatus Borkfalkiaceae bacterium]|nr:YitT family protein [Clostridia bacterium]MDY6222536.1 YitT family protein [Christensenellaceae bacterium]
MSSEHQAEKESESDGKKTRAEQLSKNAARKRFFSDCAVVLVASVLSALGFHVFVYPAKFAPGGMDGVATMLQETTHISAGWYSLILNLPLLVAAYFILKRRYVVITVSFTILNALFLIILEQADFYQYHAETDRLLPAIFSGILLGARGGMLLKIGASTGGVDIVACMVQKKRPYLNVERIIALISYVTIAFSYLVYKDLDSILLAVAQMFVYERTAAAFMKDNRNAAEFKIVTKHPEEIRNEILYTLKHGATVVDSRGMFTESESAVIFSVVNLRQIPEFLNILKKYPDTFVYYSEVTGVSGNFRRWRDEEAK